MSLFTPADILLPKSADMTKWSCIACDQFTSEPEYWLEAERLVGDEPSTLRLMLPEAWLVCAAAPRKPERYTARCGDYVNQGAFRVLPESYVCVERTPPSGAGAARPCGKAGPGGLRLGAGQQDACPLDGGTVESRLPARVEQVPPCDPGDAAHHGVHKRPRQQHRRPLRRAVRRSMTLS